MGRAAASFLTILNLTFGIGIISVGQWAKGQQGTYLRMIQNEKLDLEISFDDAILSGIVLAITGILYYFRRESLIPNGNPVELLGIFVYSLITLYTNWSKHSLILDDNVSMDVQKYLSMPILWKYVLHFGLGYSSDDYNDAWEQMQIALQCCGVDDYSDWRIASWFRYQVVYAPVPTSCCKPRPFVQGCADKVDFMNPLVSGTFIHLQGCSTKIFERVRHLFILRNQLLISVIAFCGIELVLFYILKCFFNYKLRSKEIKHE